MSRGSRSRTALRLLLVVAAVAAAAAGATIAIRRPWEGAAEASAGSPASSAVTVPVERGTLTSQLRLSATLGYGDPIALPASSGILTALPSPGQRIEAGQAVYESDGRPVVLLQGARPLWRDLSSGVDDGPDVLQLEQNLARLGFFDREPDDRFDWWTTDAVQRWHRALGLPTTGTVAVADAVVVDAPSIRLAQVTAELGQAGVSPGTYTATTLSATATLTAAQARELTAGTPVTVVLPDGTELENTLAALDPGGQPAGEDGQTTPATATIEFPDQEQVASLGAASIRVIVQNTEESEQTLIVPATALIATAQDSYAVEVLTGERIVRVPVRIGLVADARVQILASGPDVAGAPADSPSLAEGESVVVSR
ncbi:peptidoglycan-binding protein [Nocardioides sp.]|uniref:peptidoglycan-binding protein n=1 Tax=Nocardioides sp. TaxID=35761 RepID=UPI0039E48466